LGLAREETSLIFLLMDVLQQLWMHRSQSHEQRLNRRVVGDAATALRVAAHPVHKDLDAASKRRQKLLTVLRRTAASRCFAVLVPLNKSSTNFHRVRLHTISPCVALGIGRMRPPPLN